MVGGTDYFYLLAPNNARIEVSQGPGPAMSGFGHLHMVGGTDFEWFMTLTAGAFADSSIDGVNHIDFGVNEFLLDGDLVDTRGRPIDHIAYSTSEFDDARDRIEGEGFEIVEEESFKEDFGFRSFFVRTDKGVWVEIVEDADFVQ
jgi:catechol 2,3-dioxygenase-like lactoylglutathione lyase family enzyme